MDGTLLDDHGQIHPEDRRLLADPETPAWLIPTTGRPLASIRRTFTQNGLFVDRPIPLPLVLMNGAHLYLPGEIEAAYTPFSPDVRLSLIALSAAYPEVMFLYLARETIDYLNPTPFGLHAAEKYEFPIRPFANPGPELVFGKSMCVCAAPGPLAEIADRVRSLAVEGAYSMATIFEMNARGVSKGNGIRQLLAKLGLKDAPLLAAGDGENDRVLLERARISFAPVTAPPEIRSLAAHEIDVTQRGLLAPMLDSL
jgi:hydroxymethylpyrimidine pyrophosphatase-like HAD family hydrolase